MDYTTLGRTGLRVSVAGLGCGGPSRLGLRNDAQGEAHALGLIRQALDLGVNFLDTAQSYGTESVVGKALGEVSRDRLVVSTKKTLPPADHPDPEAEVRKGLEQSLKRLRTDYVDVYHLHGVEPKDYDFARDRLMPAMHRLREQGKIRFIGVTEGFVVDPSHQMLVDGLSENLWDVAMVGFNILNPSARTTVFPLAREKRVGILAMFAVRRALSQPDRLKAICAELIQQGVIATDTLRADNLLDFVLSESGAKTLPEAAYRFCRHEPSVDVVLTGTGNAAHLAENVASILKPPLPSRTLDKLQAIFGALNHLTGN